MEKARESLIMSDNLRLSGGYSGYPKKQKNVVVGQMSITKETFVRWSFL